MRALTSLALLSITISGFAFATTPSRGATIDPTQLQCRLNAKQFVSKIFFKLDRNGRLGGELDNYAYGSDGSLRFISGDVLFDVEGRENSVVGHTGDPRGLISSFSLRLIPPPNGNKWAYEQVETSGEKSHAIFTCEYKD